MITSTNRDLKIWRQLVADVAQAHAPPTLWTGPIQARLKFGLPRPASEPTHRGRGKKRHPIKTCPSRRPDVDKLTRAAFDALTKVIYLDDSQIIEVHATKEWSMAPGLEVHLKLLPTEVPL